MSEVATEQITGALETLVVSYTVKELLSQINESVTRIDTKLDSKASVEHVEQVELLVEANAQRIGQLELAKARLYGAAAGIGVVAGGAGAWVGNMLGHTP